VKNPDDAMDILQDSIYKAFVSLRVAKTPEHYKSWFYRIVVHTALDFLRKNKRLVALDHEDFEVSASTTPDTSDHLDLQKALDDLPIQYRSVVILRYFEDLKLDEVAYVLDLNINTVKTRLYKALRLLRLRID
jgi:RNA polymerase sigma-70 factor (ECF subfamily)